MDRVHAPAWLPRIVEILDEPAWATESLPRDAPRPRCRKCHAELHSGDGGLRKGSVCLDCSYVMGVDAYLMLLGARHTRGRGAR
jgi:hypothetical protein